MTPTPNLTATLWASCLILLVLIPLSWLTALIAALGDPAQVVTWVPQAELGQPPSRLAIIAAFAAMALPLLAALWALSEARGLFARYRQGDVFSLDCARRIGRIGVAMLVTAATSIPAQTGVILALTLGEPAGERMLSVSLSLWHVGVLLAAGFVTVIGHVMTEAARHVEENAGFV